MSETPTVFLGSSSEAQDNAKIIQDLLFDCGAEVTAWWSDTAFPASKTFIECLFDLARTTDASLLIASEDDRISKRGQSEFAPRDNIIFEHGLFAGSHGRARAAIATIGKPRLPTDLLGVVVLPLKSTSSPGSFKERNREPIRKWIEQLKREVSKQSGFTAKSEKQSLISFMTEMDQIWAKFDAGWHRITRQDYVAERNFAVALDQFFQCYHHVFSELLKSVDEKSIQELATHGIAEANKCLLTAWEHVAEGLMRIADEMKNDPETKGQLRQFKSLYDEASSHLQQGKRAKSMKDRYDELAKAVDSAERYMAKANKPNGTTS